MSLPFTFIPGEVASAHEVNQNFAYIASILGPLSTPGRVKTTTEFLMGTRQNVLMTATADTGSVDAGGNDNAFFQIGWNADYNLTGSGWKFGRFINKGAGVLRIGEGELSFRGTDENTQGINASMRTLMILRTTLNGDYFYLPSSLPLTNTNSVPTQAKDHRMTLTKFDDPLVIFDGLNLKTGTRTRNMISLGLPPGTKAVEISCECEAASSAYIRFLQYRGTPSRRHGFTVTGNPLGSGQGTVLLGNGPYANSIYIQTTGPFDHVYAYVTGYYI